jgi:hypothetical protein
MGWVRGDVLDSEEDCSGIFLREGGLYEEVSASSSIVWKGCIPIMTPTYPRTSSAVHSFGHSARTYIIPTTIRQLERRDPLPCGLYQLNRSPYVQSHDDTCEIR